jgi:hypothetical protein
MCCPMCVPAAIRVVSPDLASLTQKAKRLLGTDCTSEIGLFYTAFYGGERHQSETGVVPKYLIFSQK